jgi:hypothetical protein
MKISSGIGIGGSLVGDSRSAKVEVDTMSNQQLYRNAPQLGGDGPCEEPPSEDLEKVNDGLGSRSTIVRRFRKEPPTLKPEDKARITALRKDRQAIENSVKDCVSKLAWVRGYNIHSFIA